MLCSKGDKDDEQKKKEVAKPGNKAKAKAKTKAKATATLLFHYAFSVAKPAKAAEVNNDCDEDCDDLKDLLADAQKEEDKKKICNAYHAGRFAAKVAYFKELRDIDDVYERKKAAAARKRKKKMKRYPNNRVKQVQWNRNYRNRNYLKAPKKRSKALRQLLED